MSKFEPENRITSLVLEPLHHAARKQNKDLASLLKTKKRGGHQRRGF